MGGARAIERCSSSVFLLCVDRSFAVPLINLVVVIFGDYFPTMQDCFARLVAKRHLGKLVGSDLQSTLKRSTVVAPDLQAVSRRKPDTLLLMTLWCTLCEKLVSLSSRSSSIPGGSHYCHCSLFPSPELRRQMGSILGIHVTAHVRRLDQCSYTCFILFRDESYVRLVGGF